MKFQVRQNLVILLMFAILSGCGGSDSSPKPPAPSSVRVHLSAPGAEDAQIEENKIPEGIKVDLATLDEEFKIEGLDADETYTVVLREDLSQLESGFEQPTAPILKDSKPIGGGIYEVTKEGVTSSTMFSFDPASVKNEGNIRGKHHITVQSIQQSGGDVSIQEVQDDFPKGLSVQVPIQAYLSQDGKSMVDQDIEIGSNEPFYVAAQITSDYNEGATVHFQQTESLFRTVSRQKSNKNIASNDEDIALTIHEGSTAQSAFKSMTVKNAVPKNEDGTVRSFYFQLDPALNQSIAGVNSIKTKTVTVDSDPFIHWDSSVWSGAQLSAVGTYQLSISQAQSPKAGTQTIKGFVPNSDEITGTCTLTPAPQSEGVVCTYADQQINISGLKGDDIYQNYQVDLTYEDKTQGLERVYSGLNLQGAVSTDRNVIVWDGASLSVDSPVGISDQKYPISAMASAGAIVKHNDGSSEPASYICDILDQAGQTVDQSSCSATVDVTDKTKLDVHATMSDFVYDNTHQNAYKLQVSATDNTTEDPKVKAQDQSLESDIAFPSVTDHSKLSDFYTSNAMADVAKAEKDDFALPQINGDYTVANVFTHAGHSVVFDDSSDPVTLKDADQSAGSFISNPAVTLTQTLSAFPHFNWILSFNVKTQDSPEIIVDNVSTFKNGAEMKVDGDHADSTQVLNIDQAHVENSPISKDYIDMTKSTCVLVNSVGNMLSTANANQCSFNEVDETHYNIHIDDLSSSDQDRYVQVMLANSDGKITKNVFENNDEAVKLSANKPMTEAITFDVNGLPADQKSTLTLSNGDDQVTQSLDDNKQYIVDVPQDGKTWNVSASDAGLYVASITPTTSFVANQTALSLTVTFKKRTPSSKFITGYWEYWNKPLNPVGTDDKDPIYYQNDIKDMNRVLYSFLTLDKNPNPDMPADVSWDGQSIREGMSQNDIITVMTKTDHTWENPDDWQRSRIAALIQATHNTGGKFIWAIGGWSDLTQTITEPKVDAFVAKCVQLLKLSGDGIDFDWEHLSEHGINPQYREGFALVLLRLRQALDAVGMQDKEIGYTTRFNAFWDDASRPAGAASFPSDGEGITIEKTLKEHGSSLNEVVNWVNIMMYDTTPSDLGNTVDPNTGLFTLETYKLVFDSFAKYVDKDKIVMGFEPGGQVAGGKWEGLSLDQSVIDLIASENYGGSMFWAINQPALPPSTEITGDNAIQLAKYSREKFK